MQNNQHLYDYDNAFRETHNVICGVDEAGRGPLAGPVCCAAVILPISYYSPLLNDSKKVSEKKRNILFDEIVAQAVCYQTILIEPHVIDEINILNATMLGMKQAIEKMSFIPNLALIDGNTCPSTTISTQFIIKGDAHSASVAAASILAKVTRDRYMQELHEKYPEYQLHKHKGYPTKLHYEMIAQYGVQAFHRKSFLKNRGIV